MNGIGEIAAEDLITRGKKVGAGPKTLASIIGVDSRSDIANATPEQIKVAEELIAKRGQLLDRIIAAMVKGDVHNAESFRESFKRSSLEDLEIAAEREEARVADSPAPEPATNGQVERLAQLLTDKPILDEFKATSGLFAADGTVDREAVAALTARQASELITDLTRRF